MNNSSAQARSVRSHDRSRAASRPEAWRAFSTSARLSSSTSSSSSCPSLTSQPHAPAGGSDYTTWPASRGLPRASEWRLKLLLDNREVGARSDRGYFKDELCAAGVHCEVRALPLGDVLWVIESTRDPREEWVLHAIIERKRIDDLASSIIDGRYLEQKFRLQHSGVRRVMYLVEGKVQGQRNLKAESLLMAMTETQVFHGFMVKQTAHAGATVSFLTATHQELNATTFAADGASAPAFDSLPFMRFNDFAQRVSKMQQPTPTEIFGRQLRQVPRCGGAQAAAILKKYPTVASLVAAYDALPDDAIDAKEQLVAEIRPAGRGRIGPSISRCLYYLLRGRNYGAN